MKKFRLMAASGRLSPKRQAPATLGLRSNLFLRGT
jgi:hypothetical protein